MDTRIQALFGNIYISYSLANSKDTKLRLLSVTKMMEEDVVTAGDDVFDLNQDVDSDDEIEGSSKVVLRESSNFKAEVVNKTIRLVLSEYDIEMTQAIMEKSLFALSLILPV